LQTGFGSGPGVLPLRSGPESDSKKLESEHIRWAWTGSGLDIPQDTCCFFWNRIGFGYSFLKKIGSRQD